MTPRELLAEISDGKFRQVYYFYGSEEYRIVEAEKFLVRQFLGPSVQSIGARKLSGRKTTIAELLGELSAIPMLGEKLVISLTDPQHYKSADLERIARSVQQPDPNRLVVCSTPPAREPRWDSAFLKFIKTVATTVQFNRLADSESREAILGRLRKLSLSAHPDAVNLLVNLVDGRRGAIDQELAKLADFVPDKQVTVDAVKEVGAGYQSYLAFDLAEQILRGDTRRAIRQVDFLLQHGATATSIVHFLYGDLLMLYRLQHHESVNGPNAWKGKKMRPFVGRLGDEVIRTALLRLSTLDRQLRNSPANPELLLQTFVIELSAEIPSRRVA